jgi:hypothetical protein
MPQRKRSTRRQPSRTETHPRRKTELAQQRQVAQQRQTLTQAVVTVAVLGGICGFLVFLVAGLKGAIGTIVAVMGLLLSFRYPWYALIGFLIYLPLGGTVTYLVGGGSNPLLQLAKDGFYLPALVRMIQHCQQRRLPWILPVSLQLPLSLLLGYCLLVLVFINGGQQIYATGTDKPLAMGIFGLKVLLGYLPLIACAYYLVRTRQDLDLILRLLVCLILLCCTLGFLQYLFLKTGRCQGTVAEGAALFKASLKARCLVGGALLYSEEQGVIRLPGTFVAPWQWGWFLISSAFFSFAMAFFERVWLWRITGMTAMAMTLLLAVVSGQRIALALVPIAFVILLFTTGQIINFKRFLPIIGLLGLFGVAGLSAYPQVIQERIASFWGRWEAAPPTVFIAQQFEFVQDFSGLFGRGLGRATNSARSLGEVNLIETYFPKLMYEIGPVGLFLFLLLATTLTVGTFKAYRQLKDKYLRGIGATLWTFIFFISYNTYYYPLDVDPVAVYYWFVAGLILKLPELDGLELVTDQPQPEDIPNSAPVTGKNRRFGRRRPNNGVSPAQSHPSSPTQT